MLLSGRVLLSHIIICYHVVGVVVGGPVILILQHVYQVGLAVVECLCGQIPLFHHVYVWYLHLAEYGIQHLNIVAVRFAHIVSELVWRKLPVGHDYKWFLLGIFTQIFCFGAVGVAQCQHTYNG